MNRREHLLTTLMEECQELAKDAAKALRFGPLDRKTTDPTKINNNPAEPTNADRMEKEFNDVLAVINMLRNESEDFSFRIVEEWQREKQAKVERYLEYSKLVGSLDTTSA